ncbi:hypothetical protein EER27_02295 [Lysobacter psychrotolerans]|uniref:Uncharacterized protein n=2 Tax=Montanilutibacter psychrotolerans TaxID=1327343 RepID=A0A3M8SZZ6_9GAMM|nr:hypothetical protein EER27_02295 [Lysobacter psychrotolerans]
MSINHHVAESFGEWSLEPLDAPLCTTVSGKAQFRTDVRKVGNRRVMNERRDELRFNSDRRSGKDRRANRGWDSL